MKVVRDYLLQQLETLSPQDGNEERSEKFIVLHRLLQEYNKTSNVHNKDLQLETTLKKRKETKDQQDTEYIDIAPTIAILYNSLICNIDDNVSDINIKSNTMNVNAMLKEIENNTYTNELEINTAVVIKIEILLMRQTIMQSLCKR